MTSDFSSPSPEARYAALCAYFLHRGESSPSEKKGFGSSALMAKGRIFVMLTHGRLVVKLPKAEAGRGERFDANRGRPMKEWLTVDPASAQRTRMSRACSLPRSGDLSEAVMVGVIGRLRVIA
jgi:hypothetical protein